MNKRFLKNLDSALGDLNLRPEDDIIRAAESDLETGPRRSAARLAAGQMTNMQVVEDTNGVLMLVERAPSAVSGRRRIAPGRGGLINGNVVAERPMELLPYNQITGKVRDLDDSLNPNRGLREWKDGKLIGKGGDIQPLGRGKKILLFVHGTFSKSESFFDQITPKRRRFDEGTQFMNWAKDHYDQILTFDHATLSVSPFVNAHLLARQLGSTSASIDVVCHSRGGLVTRWWVEALDQGRGKRRVTYVGSPHAGTGLASPANIRSTMNLTANMANALGTVSGAVPFLQFGAGLFQIVSSVLRVSGKTPLADAVVAAIPGLAAQSRVGNNYELASLRQPVTRTRRENYYFVKSNFESEKAGWKFWKHFRGKQFGKKLVDFGTDVIFDGDNDLVVDSGSMNSLHHGFHTDKILDFGTTDHVHHCNYFRQPETLQFIRESFEAA